VWTGVQAKERGLVDRLGGFSDALKSAADRAKLGSDYRVSYIEPEPGRLARLIEAIGGATARIVAEHVDATLPAATGMPRQILRDVRRDLGWITDRADASRPFASVIHCMCTAP